jgi:hypothetical protein
MVHAAGLPRDADHTAYPLAEICRMTAEAGWREPKLEVTPVGFEAWMKK